MFYANIKNVNRGVFLKMHFKARAVPPPVQLGPQHLHMSRNTIREQLYRVKRLT